MGSGNSVIKEDNTCYSFGNMHNGGSYLNYKKIVLILLKV